MKIKCSHCKYIWLDSDWLEALVKRNEYLKLYIEKDPCGECRERVFITLAREQKIQDAFKRGQLIKKDEEDKSM